MEIKSEIKQREKDARLIGLQTRYFQLQMDLAAYKINEDTHGVEQTEKMLESCEKSYNAINEIET